MSKARILVVGAGIGGLTVAIALARNGHEVSVFEQAPVLGEVGAGISLSQAAQSGYKALGLADAINAAATVTANMAFLHYRSGRLLAGAYDHGEGSGNPEAPLSARQLHRADLHAILVDAFRSLRPNGLHLGQSVLRVEPGDTGPVLHFADGSAETGDIIIGADGLKSNVRASLCGNQPARFTQQVAYRFLVDREEAAKFMGFGRAAVFQGPERVFNRYTVRHGAVVNCVGVTRAAKWEGEGWATSAERGEVLMAYEGWHPDVIGLIERADKLIKWGIFDRAPLEKWSSGAVTLLGDAAHPMLPFLGLGAAMAVEDAIILARALSLESSAPAAFERYEAARRPRTEIVHEQSRRQSVMVQAADPDQFDAKAAPSHDPSYYAYDPVNAVI